MPFRCEVFPEHRLGRVELSGQIHGEEVLEAIRALLYHVDWQPGFSDLWDARAITLLVLDPRHSQEILSIANTHQARIGGGKSATVVTRQLDFEMVLLFIRRVEHAARDFRVFRDLEEALTWLDVAQPLSPA